MNGQLAELPEKWQPGMQGCTAACPPAGNDIEVLPVTDFVHHLWDGNILE